MHQPFTDCAFWPLLNWKLWFSFKDHLMLQFPPSRKSILRLKHKTTLIHTFRFRPWKSLMNCCTFSIVVFFLLHCELRRLGFKVRPSDICSPRLSMQTKGEQLWPLNHLRILSVLLRNVGLRKRWTFLSSGYARRLFEAFYLDYSIILEVSRATKNKTRKK